MRSLHTKTMLITALMLIGMVGLGSAQTGTYGDMAVTEQVSEFNTTTPEVAFNLSNVTDEAVTIELINDEEVTGTLEDVQLDTNGFGYATLDSYSLVDQIAVYPETTDHENVETVDIHYDYTGTAQDDTVNYNSVQTFSTFEATSGGIAFLLQILPWLIFIAVIGVLFEEL